MTQQSEHHSALDYRRRQVGSRDLATFLALFLFLSLSAVMPPEKASGRTIDLIQQSTQQPRDTSSGTGNEKDVRALEPGKPIKRELAGGQQHSYRIKLDTNQFLKAIAEQQGIDVVVQVLEPGGKHILTFDSENRSPGQESASLVAEVAGDYRLIVQPKDKRTAAGSYEIRIEELRGSTENDWALHDARKLYEKLINVRVEGKYDEEIPLAERALETLERLLGLDHREVANALNGLAFLYYYKGEYTKAEPLLQRALTIQEKTLGPEHPDLATSLNNLAALYNKRGEYAKAEPLLQRSLTIRERALGPEHPDLAYPLNNLASLRRERGEYAKAEPLLQRSLTIREKALGPEHLDLAASLNNLAALYKTRGEYAKAEPLYQRALTIQEKTLGPEHPDLATSLSNLAALYDERGEFARSEPLLQRSLSIRERALGLEHPDLAYPLNNLAVLYRKRGEYAKAEPLLQRALAVWEKVLGQEHPNVAIYLSNLANLYRQKGDYTKAEPLYQRALTISEKSLGPEHPHTASRFVGFAKLYAGRGDIPQAMTALSRANAVTEHNLALNLATGSERQKLAYLALFSSQTDFTLSLHSQAAPNNPQALNLAFTTLLRRKGRGLDAMIDTIATLRRHAASEDQIILDQLAEARSQLATLTLRAAASGKPDTYRARLQPLEEKVEELESKLSSRSAEFRAQTQPVTLAAVQAALPGGSVLVEFADFTPQELQTGKNKPPRYLAYVLPAQGRPRWVDLGEAAMIDRAVDAWRQALRDPNRADVNRLARAVDDKVMRPVRSVLGEMPGETRQLLIAPDGLLNLIPFAALVDERNRYLVERYAISYLTSGRDLLRLQTSLPNKSAPLVVANPIFGKVETRALAASTGQNSGNPQASDQVWGRIDPTILFFQSLPGTGREALEIKALLPGASVLLREQATETALKQSRAPRVLHIATHGFFLSDQEAPPAEMREIPDDDPLRISVQFSKWAAKIENPLLRSGLALTGANEHRSGDDDGVLTALEAASLDLWGTRLVVLSACDTGVGEVKNSEGVYGLRRALVLAGSEAQVMSLWPVLDNKTESLMAGYYERLLNGEGRGEALRQIQLRMLKDMELRHPHYWSNFIQAGEWANLDGQR